jgi:hypothetical protein
LNITFFVGEANFKKQNRIGGTEGGVADIFEAYLRFGSEGCFITSHDNE